MLNYHTVTVKLSASTFKSVSLLLNCFFDHLPEGLGDSHAEVLRSRLCGLEYPIPAT